MVSLFFGVKDFCVLTKYYQEGELTVLEFTLQEYER